MDCDFALLPNGYLRRKASNKKLREALLDVLNMHYFSYQQWAACRECLETGFVELVITKTQKLDSPRAIIPEHIVSQSKPQYLLIFERLASDMDMFNYFGVGKKANEVECFDAVKIFDFEGFLRTAKDSLHRSDQIERVIPPKFFSVDICRQVNVLDEKVPFMRYHRISFLIQLSNFLKSLKKELQGDKKICIISDFCKLTQARKTEIRNIILDHYFDELGLFRPKEMTVELFREMLDDSSFKHCAILIAALSIANKSMHLYNWWIEMEEALFYLRLKLFSDPSQVLFIAQVNNCKFLRYSKKELSSEELNFIELTRQKTDLVLKVPLREYVTLYNKRVAPCKKGWLLLSLQDIEAWLLPYEFTEQNKRAYAHIRDVISVQVNADHTNLPSILDFYAEARSTLEIFFKPKFDPIDLKQSIPDIENLVTNRSHLLPLCQRMHAKRLHKVPHHLFYHQRIENRSFFLSIGYEPSDVVKHWKQHFLKDGRTTEYIFEKKYAPNAESNLLGKEADSSRILISNCQKMIESSSQVTVQDIVGCPFKYLPRAQLLQELNIESPEEQRSIVQFLKTGDYPAACSFEFSRANGKQLKRSPITNPVFYTKYAFQKD